MKLLWTLTFLLISPWIVQAQSSKEEVPSRTTEVTTSYGLGGIWYLNALDGIPKWGISVDHFFIHETVDFGIRVGYEHMEETTFLPFGVSVKKSLDPHHFKGFIGYAVALNEFTFENDELEVRGGLCADFHYGYTIFSLDDLWINAVLGYQFRRSLIEYEPDSVLDEVVSRQYFHHLNLGFTVGF